MSEQIHGFPFWIFEFDEDGKRRAAGSVSGIANEIAAAKVTDLFVFSHGWNNDRDKALSLCKAFFGSVRQLINDGEALLRPGAVIGVASVIWPSILWPDNDAADTGGAASLTSEAGAGEIAAEMKKVFAKPDEKRLVDELTKLLDRRNDEDLPKFRQKLRALVDTETAASSALNSPEQQALIQNDTSDTSFFEALAELDGGEVSEGGAAAFGDSFAKLWKGAKKGLRVATYWKMKNRAGKVGRDGLGPLLRDLHREQKELRFHLMGHSFGARLVSYALTAIPPQASGEASPIKSVFLLQGAFSHFAFADKLPFDQERAGDLKGMSGRVDGPLIATHSLLDTAVGRAYPLASLLARQDAAAAQDDLLYRWGAIGHDGAQAVNATELPLSQVGKKYPFSRAQWFNLDGNGVIKNGGPPSGSHSDIVHPETAWVALAAAKVAA